MSDERRKRQEARLKEDGPRQPIPLKYLVIGAIVLIVGLAAFLGWHRHNSKLDTFSQCLGQKQAKMYGAFWCPHCADQKELFGSSFKYAPYIECGIQGSRGIAQVCVDAGVKRFPTWVFSDGDRTEGEKSLEYLSDKTGCPLP